MGFPGGSEVKAPACNLGDLGSIPGLGRFPGKGNGNPVQYSCLENPMDRGAWWATVHGVTKSWTRLSDFTFTFRRKYTHIWASLVAQLIKNPPAIQEIPVQFLGWKDPLEKGIGYPHRYSWASLVAQMVKNLPEIQETWV